MKLLVHAQFDTDLMASFSHRKSSWNGTTMQSSRGTFSRTFAQNLHNAGQDQCCVFFYIFLKYTKSEENNGKKSAIIQKQRFVFWISRIIKWRLLDIGKNLVFTFWKKICKCTLFCEFSWKDHKMSLEARYDVFFTFDRPFQRLSILLPWYGWWV